MAKKTTADLKKEKDENDKKKDARGDQKMIPGVDAEIIIPEPENPKDKERLVELAKPYLRLREQHRKITSDLTEAKKEFLRAGIEFVVEKKTHGVQVHVDGYGTARVTREFAVQVDSESKAKKNED